ncbi:1-phosphofructokinase [Aliivibrio kagoshimensis]|uniref:1-phosphofructokinase n=1 Tax=Aliivibrio kagoshimensis TaxID=2910230 RepID=UPI003D0D0A9E
MESHELRVVTVTLNPALDLTGSLNQLNVGSVSLVDHSSLHPAGKGVNVAKVLADLGANVTVTGILGEDNQEPFCHLFSENNITDAFIRVEGASRINVKLVEPNGQVSDINFPGVTVSELDRVAFETQLFALADTHDFFVIAGSLPRGVTPEHCAAWISELNKRNKKVIFDSSKAALYAGIDAVPWLVKPNDEELADWAGKAIEDRDELLSVAEAISKKGITNVVVSLGAQGVLWLQDNNWLQSVPPKMKIVSTVGAGDTLVAGMCWGALQQWDRTKTLRFATALSAQAVAQIGVGVESLETIVKMADLIEVSSVQVEGNS